MSKNVLQTIRSRTDSFSRGQKRIADYILMNYDKAAFMTAGHLGRKAQVSESTVVRFASQLGYDGYPNMQRALQELVRGKLTSLQRIQVSRDQMQEQDVLTGVMQRDMNSIHTAIESVDRAAFDQVVDRLLTASHIYLMGVRSSAFLAGYLNFYLHLMFKNVTLVQNAAAGEIFEQLSQIGPGDVLVGISFPRYSQMAIHAVEYARDRGADVVAITDGQMSPLYRMATVSLLVRSDMISFVDSMAAPLSLLNALIVAVGRQKNEEVSGTFSQLENVWSKYNIFGKTEDASEAYRGGGRRSRRTDGGYRRRRGRRTGDAAGAQRPSGQKTEHHRQGPVQRDQQLLPGGASAEHPPERAVSVRGLRPVRQPGRHGLF